MTSFSPKLYTSEDIHTLEFPNTVDGEYARRYLLPIIQNGPETYIDNIYNTKVMVAKVGETLLPITVSDFHPRNAYTVSPYSHYVSYGGFEEVHRLQNPPVEAIIKLMMQPLAYYFRHAGLDKVVYVNNWLLSTNLYPSVSREQISALSEALVEWFPDRAIVFRSLDRVRSPHICDLLSEKGFELVLSRQIWFMDADAALKLRQTREDIRLVKRNGHVLSDELRDDELERGVELYKMLYLDKYSYYNPQFNVEYLRRALHDGWLTIRTLRKDDKVNAIMGYFARNGAMTIPLFGYDTSLPAETALYRHLTVEAFREASANHLLLHASAGVGKFKKNRGAERATEYNAVMVRHLPMGRQIPWKVIKKVGEIALPTFQKNDF